MRIAQLARNRQRRNHMPTGTPAGDQYPQRRSLGELARHF